MEALVPGGVEKCYVTLHKPLPAGTVLYAHPQPAAQDAQRIESLELEVRPQSVQIAMLRALLDERPPHNADLAWAYMCWTQRVYETMGEMTRAALLRTGAKK